MGFPDEMKQMFLQVAAGKIEPAESHGEVL